MADTPTAEAKDLGHFASLATTVAALIDVVISTLHHHPMPAISDELTYPVTTLIHAKELVEEIGDALMERQDAIVGGVSHA